VLVNADNDAPSLIVGADQTVWQNDNVALNAVAIEPEGQTVAYRWEQVSGPPVELEGSLTDAPTFRAPNVLGATDLVFRVEASDGTHVVVDTVTITVDGENDPIVAVAGTSSGAEDTTRTIFLRADDPDLTDSVERFRVESLPGHGVLTLHGAPVSAGDEIDASAIASGSLRFEPDGDWSGQTAFEFSAFDGDAWSASSATQTISIAAVADAPVVEAGAAAGLEDTAIDLTFSAAVTDLDGSESISRMLVAGAPAGSVFSDGALSATATSPSGWVDLTGFDLSSLTVTPAQDHDVDFTLTVRAYAREASNGSETWAQDTVTVHIGAVSDAPVALGGGVTVGEDTVSPVMPPEMDPDTGDFVETLRLESLPDQGVLRLSGSPVAPGDLISAADIAAGLLTYEPDPDWSGVTSFGYSVHDGELWSEAPGTLTITVAGVADAPDVDAGSAAGDEDSAIPLSFTFATTDTDGSESISRVTVAGSPEGSVLSDGVNSAVAGAGEVDLTGWSIGSLTITPPPNHDTDFDLTLTVTAREPDSGHETTASDTVTVGVIPHNDASNAVDTTIALVEDSPTPVHLAANDPDTGDAMEVFRIDALPEHGRLLLDGVEVTAGQEIGVVQVALGRLVFEPDEHWSGSTAFTFSVSDGDVWSDPATATLDVEARADHVDLGVTDVETDEDTAATIPIAITPADTDGSEVIASITIEGLPAGATITDGVRSFTADHASGAVDVTGWSLGALAVTPPPDSGDDFTLRVEVTTDDGGHRAVTDADITVTVRARADDTTLTVADAAGMENGGPISLGVDITTSDADGSETVRSLTLSGLPAGAMLSDGVRTFAAGADADAVDISGWDLASLSVTPPPGLADDFTLSITMEVVDEDDAAEVTRALRVHMTPAPPAPTPPASDPTGETIDPEPNTSDDEAPSDIDPPSAERAPEATDVEPAPDADEAPPADAPEPDAPRADTAMAPSEASVAPSPAVQPDDPWDGDEPLTVLEEGDDAEQAFAGLRSAIEEIRSVAESAAERTPPSDPGPAPPAPIVDGWAPSASVELGAEPLSIDPFAAERLQPTEELALEPLAGSRAKDEGAEEVRDASLGGRASADEEDADAPEDAARAGFLSALWAMARGVAGVRRDETIDERKGERR
jgi:hypothetical protein